MNTYIITLTNKIDTSYEIEAYDLHEAKQKFDLVKPHLLAGEGVGRIDTDSKNYEKIKQLNKIQINYSDQGDWQYEVTDVAVGNLSTLRKQWLDNK